MDFSALRDRLGNLDDRTWSAIRRAAKNGESEAQYLMGCRCLWGFSDLGCKKWLSAAAAQDHPEALYQLSQITFHPSLQTTTIPETTRKRRLLEKAARLGSANAQRDLAVCHVWGEFSFKTDWTKVRYWYLKAARQGHQESQTALGCMMIQGDGGPVNRQRGLAFLRAAARGRVRWESRIAAEALARYHSGGSGVPKNLEKAAKWKAIAESLPTSQDYIRSIEKQQAGDTQPEGRDRSH